MTRDRRDSPLHIDTVRKNLWVSMEDERRPNIGEKGLQ